MQFPASLARLSLMVADTSGTNLFWFFTRGHLVLFLVILKFSSAFFQWFWRWLLFHNHKVEHFPLQQYLAVSKFLLLLFQHLLGSSTELWVKVMSSVCHAYDESLVVVLHYSLSDYILQYNHRKEECKDISLQNSSYFSFLRVSTLGLIFWYVFLMTVTNSSVTRYSIRYSIRFSRYSIPPDIPLDLSILSSFHLSLCALSNILRKSKTRLTLLLRWSKVYVNKICTYHVNKFHFWPTHHLLILANEVSN